MVPELRRRSAERLVAIGFDGYAIGGLAVGEPREVMFATLEATVPFLPQDKPRYLMGVGKPADLVGAVLRGVDMFDCVLPTRSGRTGQAWTRGGPVNLRNARHGEDIRPLDPNCACPCCRSYSRAYLHHVVKSGEIIASMLLTAHNLHFFRSSWPRCAPPSPSAVFRTTRIASPRSRRRVIFPCVKRSPCPETVGRHPGRWPVEPDGRRRQKLAQR